MGEGRPEKMPSFREKRAANGLERAVFWVLIFMYNCILYCYIVILRT